MIMILLIYQIIFFTEGVMFYTNRIRYKLKSYKSKEDARKYIELDAEIENLIRKFVFGTDTNISKEDEKQFLKHKRRLNM